MSRVTITAAAAALAAAPLTVPSGPVLGQAESPPAVCQTDAAFRAFDFWIGDWTVYSSADGTEAGTNRIEARENGCVLVESWEGRLGNSGMSMNYYDSITGQWRQVWVANNYSIDIVGGLNDAGAMVLEGHLHNYRFGRAFEFRGTWTPNADGTVRQLFEQKDPATGEWGVWFDGRYERRN